MSDGTRQSAADSAGRGGRAIREFTGKSEQWVDLGGLAEIVR